MDGAACGRLCQRATPQAAGQPPTRPDSGWEARVLMRHSGRSWSPPLLLLLLLLMLLPPASGSFFR